MENILNSISDIFLGNGAIIAIGCMIVGLFIKGTFTKIPNNFIPLINIVLSLILGFIIPGTFEDKDIVSKVILLICLGFTSVGIYEGLCILIKNRFSVDVKKIVNNIFSKTEIEEESIVESEPDYQEEIVDETDIIE